MTQIKSEKALSFIREHILIQRDGSKRVMHYIAESAVEIAETEAEQRHAKELQEFKDRAIVAFCSRCQCKYNCPKKQCENLDLFTQKLNEL